MVRPEPVGISPVRLLHADGGLSPPGVGVQDAFGDADADVSLFVDLRRESAKALPDEGDISQHAPYLTAPEAKFPRHMATEAIVDTYQEAREATVATNAGL